MVDILHKVGIKSSSPDDAYGALTTLKGLSGFLLGLKSLLETGTGAPAPNDIKLDSWE
jgi:hypothetical protein